MMKPKPEGGDPILKKIFDAMGLKPTGSGFVFCPAHLLEAKIKATRARAFRWITAIHLN